MLDFLPFALLLIVLAWGLLINAKTKFKVPPEPIWPQSGNPGLAMELAASEDFVSRLLGPGGTREGDKNRTTIVTLQKLDFVFIPLYVAFFAAVALQSDLIAWQLAVTGAAVLAGVLDYAEDAAIIRMAHGEMGTPAGRFGRPKWLFFFLAATLSSLALLPTHIAAFSSHRSLWIFGAVLCLAGLAGIGSSLMGSFTGIGGSAKAAMFGLIGFLAAPVAVHASGQLTTVAEYIVLLRVPILFAAVLLALPYLAFGTSARSLLRGLFEVTPLSMLAVSLAATGLAAAVTSTGRLIYLHSRDRLGVPAPPMVPDLFWDALVAGLGLPLIIAAIVFSYKQKPTVANLVRLIVFAIVGLASVSFVTHNGGTIAEALFPVTAAQGPGPTLAQASWFAGYFSTTDPLVWKDHFAALVGFGLTLLLYAVLGFYGRSQLGKSNTVPALAAALMLMVMLCWMFGAATFFFDLWHVPVLLVAAVVGVITAQSARSDHYYDLIDYANTGAAPSPAETVAASRTKRIILVAANGGGIQAGAWAAQVLQGLTELNGPQFTDSIRLISSVSGGSVGSACFLSWLADRAKTKPPAEAAKESSLDEVAWGLAWPDFLRGWLPWIFGYVIARGRALEMAWIRNSAVNLSHPTLNQPLSSWNGKVRSGELPAVIMNATIAETGERLLLATTEMTRNRTKGRARVDAAQLHTINGKRRDVAISTAARLSASFTYVTPASRSNAAGPQPHIVDGGYYDNYGMATLVEWLEEAASGNVANVESVLVLQIHGAPVSEDNRDARHGKDRGWFYQAAAPLITLANVRTAGQIAHNDIELGLLERSAKIPIHSVTFEFPDPNAPLSWHLTHSQQEAIGAAWADPNLAPCKNIVQRFLAGNDNLGCGCTICRPPAKSAKAP